MLDTPVKRRITSIIGPRWSGNEIARRAGLLRQQVNFELRCTGKPGCDARHVPTSQMAIARVLGVSVRRLFGRHAWSYTVRRRIPKTRQRRSA